MCFCPQIMPDSSWGVDYECDRARIIFWPSRREIWSVAVSGVPVIIFLQSHPASTEGCSRRDAARFPGFALMLRCCPDACGSNLRYLKSSGSMKQPTKSSESMKRSTFKLDPACIAVCIASSSELTRVIVLEGPVACEQCGCVTVAASDVC